MSQEIGPRTIVIDKDDLFLLVSSIEVLLRVNECPDIDRALFTLRDLGLASWIKNNGQEILVEVIDRDMEW